MDTNYAFTGRNGIPINSVKKMVRANLRPDLKEQIKCGLINKEQLKELIDNYRIEGEGAIEGGSELLKIARELETKLG